MHALLILNLIIIFTIFTISCWTGFVSQWNSLAYVGPVLSHNGKVLARVGPINS